jgi:UDP-3-O-[3-hydroxymyristoyl] glucosamine N-acyltransferase
MVESQFYDRPRSMTVGEIITLTGAAAAAGADLTREISNVAPIDEAGPSDLTFLESGKFADALASCRAGVILTNARFATKAPAGAVVLESKAPYRAFVTVVRTLYPHSLQPTSAYGESGVAASASVHPTAKLGEGVTINPGVVVGANAEIGAGTIISSNAVIGQNVRIGSHCSIGPNCSIMHATLGDRVVVHPGCHIGQDGFGYVSDAKGHMKVPQIGTVVIHNDVEIGAGTSIDRGGIRDTVIGEGSKIDNLVQIGHNVRIGKNCIVCGQTGLSGSVTIEDNAVLAGAVGIAPHAVIGRGAVIAARSGVIGDIPAGETWGGYPAKPRTRWLREQGALSRLAAPKSSGSGEN